MVWMLLKTHLTRWCGFALANFNSIFSAYASWSSSVRPLTRMTCAIQLTDRETCAHKAVEFIHRVQTLILHTLQRSRYRFQTHLSFTLHTIAIPSNHVPALPPHCSSHASDTPRFRPTPSASSLVTRITKDATLRRRIGVSYASPWQFIRQYNENIISDVREVVMHSLLSR